MSPMPKYIAWLFLFAAFLAAFGWALVWGYLKTRGVQ
jgi:membrane protein DedA with SNARE-associated domain